MNFFAGMEFRDGDVPTSETKSEVISIERCSCPGLRDVVNEDGWFDLQRVRQFYDCVQ